MKTNTLICIIGPSGSGKSTLVKKFMKIYGEKYPSNTLVSDTTREIRAGEINGESYNFMTEAEFSSKPHIESIMYNGKRYGLSIEELGNKRSLDGITFFVCDIEGYILLKNMYPDKNVYAIYIKMASSQCIQNMRIRKGVDKIIDDKIKDRVFYDCSIDAYNLDSKFKFDAIVRYKNSYIHFNQQFFDVVTSMYENDRLKA